MAEIKTNEDVLNSFLTNLQKEVKKGNLSTHYNEHDKMLLLRNYNTLIATRVGDKVKISNKKFSQTTSTIQNRLEAMANERNFTVNRVEQFEEGGSTGHERFKEGIKVRVAEAYLNDEASPEGASAIAIVMGEPSDEEELVMIQYKDGSVDYLGQEWLEPIKSSGGKMNDGGEIINGVPVERVKGDAIDYHKLKKVEFGSPLGGDYFIKDGYGYAQSGYGWIKFSIKDLKKVKMSKGGSVKKWSDINWLITGKLI